MTPVEQYHRRVVGTLVVLATIIGATTLALATIIYVFEASDAAARESVGGYHLRSLNIAREITQELDRVGNLPSNVSGVLQVDEAATLNSLMQSITARVQDLHDVQTHYGDSGQTVALGTVETRFARLIALPVQTPAQTVRAMTESFRLAVAQFEKLHVMRANAMMAQMESGRDEQMVRLIAAGIAILTVSIALIAYAYHLLGSSLKRQLETEIALENSEKRLRDSEKLRAVGQLVGGVAHDFNNLLTIINGYAESAATDKDLPAAVRPALREILNAGTRAADLTRQLLAFSRRQPVETRLVNLNVLVPESTSMLKPLIGDRVDLSFELDREPMVVEADVGQLQQVLTNLIVNARDAVSGRGTIAISTTGISAAESAALDLAPGSYCRLSVADDGIGMDDDTLGKVFEPFFTTKDVGEGVGLGLSTVHGIVAGFDGEVRVDSAINRGTRFDIYLPRCDEARISSPTEFKQPLRGGTETLLLVEDEMQILELAAKQLSKLGYRVLAASDGRHAVELSKANPATIDLIVSDVIMPEMNGPEAVGEILRVQPRARVIYVSGYTDDVVLQSGVESSGAVLIRKPFNLDDLARLVRANLDEDSSAVA